MTLLIKRAESLDAGQVTYLAALLWPGHNVDELRNELGTVILNEDALIVLCCRDDKALGFAYCGLRHDYVEGTKTSPVAYLEGVFVLQEWRQKGLACLLLAYCQEWARHKGCVELASDCELGNKV